MKRHLVLVGVGLVALVSASLAVANGFDGKGAATAASATFSATVPSGQTETRTCTTTTGKTIVTTRGSFTGAAASTAADLNGPLTVDAKSVINTTDNIGVVDAHLRIAAAAGKTDLHFSGVYDAGNVAGLAAGKAATDGVKVLGNLSGAFSTTTGFAAGSKLGGGTSGGSAVLLGPARCAPDKPVHENTQAEGTVTSNTPPLITVAGLTCTVPASLTATAATFHVNDRAHIRCEVVAGVTTLVKIDPQGHH